MKKSRSNDLLPKFASHGKQSNELIYIILLKIKSIKFFEAGFSEFYRGVYFTISTFFLYKLLPCLTVRIYMPVTRLAALICVLK